MKRWWIHSWLYSAIKWINQLNLVCRGFQIRQDRSAVQQQRSSLCHACRSSNYGQFTDSHRLYDYVTVGLLAMDISPGRIPLHFRWHLRWFALFGLFISSFFFSFCIVADNALLTQSHYMLMEPILLFFALSGLLCVLKFRALHPIADAFSFRWWGWLTSGIALLTCSFWY